MRFQKSNILLISSATALLTACDVYELPSELEDAFKAPISLSVGGADGEMPQVRAVVTDGTGKTLNPFDADAKIFMVMKSEYDTDHDDYAGARDAKYTVTRGNVAKDATTVVFDAVNQRYWDDAHARSSQLDVWAYAVRGTTSDNASFEVPHPGGGTGLAAYDERSYDTSVQPSPAWTTGVSGEVRPAIHSWKVSEATDHAQTQASILQQDLLFSNNLTNNEVYNGSGGDKRLKFDFTNRKFPQEGNAQMIFYHAMAKVTIHIKKGDGFISTDPFAFTTGNVKLMGFNTEGLFNIMTGQFEHIDERADVPTIYQWTTPATDDAYTLEALVVPNADGNITDLTDTGSRLTDGSTAKSMEFVIDNNRYEISQDQLYDALKANTANAAITADGKVNLEVGKNYVFTFTVGKTKISNITAQVAPWENVNADPMSPTNARIKLLLEERGEAQTSDVAFYKKEDNKTTDGIDDNYTVYNWTTGYTNMGATYGDGHWTTNLFWQSSKDFYHFRALMPAATGVTTASAGDYAALASGSTYTDLRWGAPMKDDDDNETAGAFKWTYDPASNGFDNAGHTQIYKAIGATENPVKLILFHMMSDLTFNISTTTGADKVTLADGAKKTKVEIVGFYPGGQVLLGTGLVKTTGTDTETKEVAWSSESAGTHVYKYGVVPQGLTSVKLRITTPDNNQYIVDLKDVKATEVTTANIVNPYTAGTDGKYTIGRWYPGFKYVYSFTLKKTGITNLVATVVNWETITADNETVVIK